MKKNSGETIVEILIATTILVMIITSTYSILLRAMSTNTSIKNRVRALNIAREGIEGVRNIRDTNWLQYSGNRRNQWLCRPGLSSSGGRPSTSPYSFTYPIPNNLWYNEGRDLYGLSVPDQDADAYIHYCLEDIKTGYYIIEYYKPEDEPFNARYFLEPQLAPGGDLLTNRERFRLFWWNTSDDPDNRTEERLTHAALHWPKYNSPSEKINTPSIFYRIIEIEVAAVYEDPAAFETGAPNEASCKANPFQASCCLSNSIDPSCSEKKIKVTSNVEWDEGGDGVPDQSVTLETNLFDYFERTSY